MAATLASVLLAVTALGSGISPTGATHLNHSCVDESTRLRLVPEMKEGARLDYVQLNLAEAATGAPQTR